VAAEAAFKSVNKEAYGAMKQMMRKLGLEVNETRCGDGRMEAPGRRRIGLAANTFAPASRFPGGLLED